MNWRDSAKRTFRDRGGLRLLDDDFMAKVFEDKACAELLLRIILKKDDLVVNEVCGQLALKNLQGRSARLDVFATDSTGKVYDIEVQRSDRGAVAKRARYNAALIDANITEPGDEYQALNDVTSFSSLKTMSSVRDYHFIMQNAWFWKPENLSAMNSIFCM